MRRWVTWVALSAALAGCGDDPVPEAGAELVNHGHAPPAKPPANTVGGFSIELPAVKLSPGAEIEPCYIFPLDLTGPSHVVGGAVLHVTEGMHHGNINTRPKTGEGFRPCGPDDQSDAGLDVVKGGAVLFGSSTQVSGDEWQRFPDGMGYRVDETFEIVARMHYLNVTSAPLTVAPKYEWFTIDEAKVTQLVGAFIWIYSGFEIPPRSSLTVTGGCDFPSPMHLVSLLPHMHKLGRRFTGGYLGGALDGKLFLDSKGYDPDSGVLTQYDPAVDLSQGEGATFSCSWDNTLDKTIHEGIGDNEMCMLFGYAWPPENAFTAVATPPDACLYIAPPSD